MHSEFYMINEETATLLNQAKKEGRRIIAVGTTSTRTLEANMQQVKVLISLFIQDMNLKQLIV